MYYCPICLDTVTNDALLLCKHYMCLDCVRLLHNVVCPICRAPLVSPLLSDSEMQTMNDKYTDDINEINNNTSIIIDDNVIIDEDLIEDFVYDESTEYDEYEHWLHVNTSSLPELLEQLDQCSRLMIYNGLELDMGQTIIRELVDRVCDSDFRVDMLQPHIITILKFGRFVDTIRLCQFLSLQ